MQQIEVRVLVSWVIPKAVSSSAAVNWKAQLYLELEPVWWWKTSIGSPSVHHGQVQPMCSILGSIPKPSAVMFHGHSDSSSHIGRGRQTVSRLGVRGKPCITLSYDKTSNFMCEIDSSIPRIRLKFTVIHLALISACNTQGSVAPLPGVWKEQRFPYP